MDIILGSKSVWLNDVGYIMSWPTLLTRIEFWIAQNKLWKKTCRKKLFTAQESDYSKTC